MTTKSLADQLAALEDAEKRLRPLVVDARQLIQDLRRVELEVKDSILDWQIKAVKIANEPIEKGIKQHIQDTVDRELKIFVEELGKKQHAIYKQIENAFDQLSSIFLGVDDNRGDLQELLLR
jgi:predicted transcriptional regulator